MTANLSPDSPSSLIYIDDSPTPEVTSAKERMAYDLVDSTIPARNNLRGLPALVVLLGDIFKDANKRREITRLIDARSVSVIAGNGHYFPKYVLRSQAKRDIYDNSGTLSDIYEISAEAKAAGWKALLFADELTMRQHAGVVCTREDATRTLTVVNIDCVPTDALLNHSSTFYIRRLPIVTAIGECSLPKPQKPNLPPIQGHSLGFHANLQDGFYLPCPDEPIFSESTERNMPWMIGQTLVKIPHHLPQELIDQILVCVKEDELQPLKDLINLDDTISLHDNGMTLLQPLVRLTETERSFMSSAIGSDGGSRQFIFGEWKGPFPASRRDVSRISSYFTDRSFIVFLLRPLGEDGTLEAVAMSMFPSANHQYSVLQRTDSLTELRSWLQDSDCGMINARAAHFGQGREIFTDPAWSFPPGLPHWNKQQVFVDTDEARDWGYGSWINLWMRFDAWLCFYLTSSLTEAERATVEGVVKRDDPGGRDFVFVPWTRDVDGGPDDMLRISHMVEHAGRHMDDSSFLGPLVFIDRQSGQDHKVIVCNRRYILDHGNIGIEYGRHDHEIANFLVNVPGNMDFADWISPEDTEFLKYPNYTGPLSGD